MSYTLKYNHPHFPKGTEFNVGNLGRVPNGGSIEVDEEMERLFVMSNGVAFDNAFKGDAMVELSGKSSLDPSEVKSILEFFAPAEEVVPEQEVTAPPASSFLSSSISEGGEENA